MSEYKEMKFLPKEVLIEFIADHPFQWFASLTFEGPVTQGLARDRLRDWSRKICRTEGMQLAFIAVVVQEECRCHLHALILGRNRCGKTLHGVSLERWERAWWKVNCGPAIPWRDGARIDPVYDTKGLSRYVIEDNLIRYRLTALTDLFFYNERLLAKSRAKRGNKNPAAGREVVSIRRRNGEEYRRVKDHMISFIEQLEKSKSKKM